MEVFIDKKSNLQFLTSKDDHQIKNGIDNYPLINWCIQFLSQELNIIDFGANIGEYSFILSSHCKHVYAFESNNDKLTCLEQGKILNNINNITVQMDLIDLNDVGFIKIYIPGEELKILQKMTQIITSNYYPPIVFYANNQDTNDFLKKLGYKVFNINNCPNMYLASEHIEYIKFKNQNNKIGYIKALTNYKNNQYHKDDLILLASKAIYFNDFQLGIEVCENLIFSDDMKSFGMNTIYQYIKPISYIKKIMLNCPMRPNRMPNNPSLLKIPNGYLCNIRCLNYVHDPHLRFLDQNKYLSDHMLLTLTNNFMIKKTVELIDKTNNIYIDSFVKGVDDLRLIDDHRFICVHGNFNSNRVVEQCLGTFNEKGEITKLIPLKGPNPYRHEKNWLPYIKDDKLYIVYSFNPFTLYEVNEETGDLILIKQNEFVKNFDMRGSAPFISYKGGLLATVHQSCDNCYMQRFVWMDEDFNTLKYSIPFYFERKGLQYSMGMTHSDEGLLITYSMNENNPCIIVVDYHVVDEFLKI